MITAIPVLGPPAAGKTALLRRYSNVVHVGEYAKSLPESNPLKAWCREHWREDRVFCPELLQRLLEAYPLPDDSWVLLDGTPRNAEQLPVVQDFFDIRAHVVITIDDLAWEERAFNASKERTDRVDSTFQKLWNRKRRYENEISLMPPLPNRYTIDNTHDFVFAQERMEDILKEVIIREMREGKNGRVYGHR